MLAALSEIEQLNYAHKCQLEVIEHDISTLKDSYQQRSEELFKLASRPRNPALLRRQSTAS